MLRKAANTRRVFAGSLSILVPLTNTWLGHEYLWPSLYLAVLGLSDPRVDWLAGCNYFWPEEQSTFLFVLFFVNYTKVLSAIYLALRTFKIVMSSVRTKESTECLFDTPAPEVVLNFAIRSTQVLAGFHQRKFKSSDRHSEENVLDAIAQLKKDALPKCPASTVRAQMMMDEEKDDPPPLPLHTGKKKKRGGHFTWDKLTWREKINRKRELVLACLLKQAVPNLAAAARFAGVSKATANSVFLEHKLSNKVASYDYNNVKSAEQKAPLEADIAAIENGFMTVADLKRRHPSFSRKAILKHIHHQGYRFRLLPKNTLNPEQRVVNSTRVCRVISHIVQAMADFNTTVLYIDEMKFPLVQTSSHRWQHPDTDWRDAVFYNRRTAHTQTLTAIALCSQEKFEAVQLFRNEVNGDDFTYFLNTAIAHLPPGKSYTIIADNATWHTSEAVRSCKASKFLFFNEPRMFQLNLIENAFSFVRHAFRKRPIVETIEDEAKNIMRIFFDSVNKRRFKGLVRNHLRQLEKYLGKHRPS